MGESGGQRTKRAFLLALGREVQCLMCFAIGYTDRGMHAAKYRKITHNESTAADDHQQLHLSVEASDKQQHLGSEACVAQRQAALTGQPHEGMSDDHA